MLAELKTSLVDKVGIRIGNLPEGFSGLGHFATISYTRERDIHHIGEVDYILLDSRCLRLSNMAYILQQIPQKLVDHGCLILWDSGDGTAGEIRQLIVQMAGMELIAAGHDLQLYRMVRPKPVPIPVLKPLRYRLVDSIHLPEAIRNMARRLFEGA